VTDEGYPVDGCAFLELPAGVERSHRKTGSTLRHESQRGPRKQILSRVSSRRKGSRRSPFTHPHPNSGRNTARVFHPELYALPSSQIIIMHEVQYALSYRITRNPTSEKARDNATSTASVNNAVLLILLRTLYLDSRKPTHVPAHIIHGAM
jgi:hypothetical protein